MLLANANIFTSIPALAREIKMHYLVVLASFCFNSVDFDLIDISSTKFLLQSITSSHIVLASFV